MPDPDFAQRVEAEFAKRNWVRRRRAFVVATLALVALLGGGYYTLGSLSTSSKPCGAPPAGSDVQMLAQAMAYSDCLQSLAHAKPPIIVFRGTLNADAEAVADIYVRTEWVKRDCAAATRLFHPVRDVYDPVCRSSSYVPKDYTEEFLVAGTPQAEEHCTDNSYYRLRASQCYVYRFILHTNRLSSGTDSRGRVTRYWEYLITRRAVWLKVVHRRWQVVLESDEGDHGFFGGDPGYGAAKKMWAHRTIPQTRRMKHRS